MTAQIDMYAAIAIDVPNSRIRITARMGAGPPAVTEAKVESPAPTRYTSATRGSFPR